MLDRKQFQLLIHEYNKRRGWTKAGWIPDSQLPDLEIPSHSSLS
jgi:hypothetical protein